jgi:hypothetical protein
MTLKEWNELPEARRRTLRRSRARLAANGDAPPEVLTALYEKAQERLQVLEWDDRYTVRPETSDADRERRRRQREREQAVCRSLVGNPNAPPVILIRLATRFPAEFCANPAAPLLVLEVPDVAQHLRMDGVTALLRRGDAPGSLLAALGQRIGWPAARAEIASHVAVTGEAGGDWREEAAQALAVQVSALSDGDRSLLALLLEVGAAPPYLAAPLRSALAAQAGTAPRPLPAAGELLAKTLPPEPSYAAASLHRTIALMHPDVPSETLRRLSVAYWWPGRFAVAVNPAVSAVPDVLAALAEDGNRFVRAAARARLSGTL